MFFIAAEQRKNIQNCLKFRYHHLVTAEGLLVFTSSQRSTCDKLMLHSKIKPTCFLDYHIKAVLQINDGCPVTLI